MDAEQTVLYFERQQYNLNKLWLIYFLLGFPLLGIIIYNSFQQMLRKGPILNMPDEDMAFFLLNGGVLIILLLIPLFINALVLTIKVFPEILKIELGPWLKRTVNLDEILAAEVVLINREELLQEYGQRKPAWQFKSHNTYFIKGKEAVRLQLDDGTQIYVGSQRPFELQKVLKSHARMAVSS